MTAVHAVWIRGAALALGIACVVYVAAVIVFGNLYAVTVRNVGSEAVTATIAFPSGQHVEQRISLNEAFCDAAWVERDGLIEVRVGLGKAGVYAGADLGDDLLFHLTADSAVHAASPMFFCR